MVADADRSSQPEGPDRVVPREEVVWRRGSGWVHRVLTGAVVVGAAEQGTRMLGGLAAGVWLALDEPGSEAKVLDRMCALGARAGEAADEAEVHRALTMLMDAGVIEVEGR